MSTDVRISKRKLGKTDIEVTPIGLGMMEFAGGGGLMGFAFPNIDQEIKNATIQAGLDGGVNWFCRPVSACRNRASTRRSSAILYE